MITKSKIIINYEYILIQETLMFTFGWPGVDSLAFSLSNKRCTVSVDSKVCLHKAQCSKAIATTTSQ